MTGDSALLAGLVALLTGAALLRQGLTWLNVRHLRRHGGEVPEAFLGEIDAATLVRISAYTADRARLASLEALTGTVLLLAFLLAGGLPWLVARLPDAGRHFVAAGLAFFALLALADLLAGLPFTLWETFVIERRYGFSTITPRLWIADELKGLLLTAGLLGPLLAAFLGLLRLAPDTWWFWSWLLFAGFQVLLLWLYPALIAPLFNRFEPIAEGGLRQAIEALAARAGLKTSGIFRSDAGRRSRHTNAYFTGLGRTKRIVLFDTLLEAHGTAEILAVLAHEMGHWQRHHLRRQLLPLALASLALFWAAGRLVAWPPLYGAVGLAEPVPFAGLFLTALLLGPLSLLASPLLSARQRRFEREADDAAVALTGGGTALAAALRRLARENLANLHPHPLYARWFYAHPPLAERIARLEERGQKAP